MIKSILKLMLAIVLFASCSQTEKAPSGMAFKITHGSGNEKLIQQGQIIKFNVEYRLKKTTGNDFKSFWEWVKGKSPKDSVLQTTIGKMPAYIQFDTARMKAMKYDFPEFLAKLRKGDKAEFSLSIDTLEKLGGIQINDIFKKGDFIVGEVEILNVFATPEMATADRDKEVALEKVKLNKPIKDYLAKNKINAKETPEGVFVVVKTLGDTSNKIDASKEVSVNYKGYNLKGEVFDTNIKPGDATAKPFDVRIGENGVIPGWEIGLTYFGKGGTGTLYIPSYLAYGEAGSGPVKPNENIVFDIEIVDIKLKQAMPQQGNNAIMDQLNEQIKASKGNKSANPAEKK
jgi:FKBP-type peptidyl-prolyl cis-trans isomerase